ncbi:MAG: tRNA pseudouridine(38-40) synthase TruA, partial [Actinomycetota bacterium]
MTQPDQSLLNEPALRRVRLRVRYHGAQFRGFAINKGINSIEGVLTEVMSTVARHKVQINVAGRTDAGVHARGQVITIDIPATTRLSTFIRSVNALCKPHIAVSEPEWVDNDFDARYSAIWRRYRYTVHNGDTPDPMLLDRAWHVSRPLSLPLMNLACDAIIGEHNFSAFCRKQEQIEGAPIPSMHRRVYSARWIDEGNDILVFEMLLCRCRAQAPPTKRHARSSPSRGPRPRLPSRPRRRPHPLGCWLPRRTYFVTITFVRFVTVFGFFTFAVAFGVTATDNVHVPTFKLFTVDLDTEQIFFDVLTTVSTTFAPLGTEIFADLLIVEKEIVFPFFTFGVTTA